MPSPHDLPHSGPDPEVRERRFVPGLRGRAEEAAPGVSRTERVLRVAVRLSHRGRATQARTLLERILRGNPNHQRALALWIEDVRQRAPSGVETPGLRELAGRPGAWRARIHLAGELAGGEDGSLARSWIESALEAAPEGRRELVWDRALGELARRDAWSILARCAEPLLEESPPHRASLLAIDAWLRLGDRDSARRLATGLPRELLDRQPWSASLRVPRNVAEAPAAPASRFTELHAPLWSRAEAPPDRVVVFTPAVPKKLAAEASTVLAIGTDLAHCLASLSTWTGKSTSLVLRRDARGRVLAPTRSLRDREDLEALLEEAQVDAPLVLTGKWQARAFGGRRLQWQLWDRELGTCQRFRTHSVAGAAERIAARLRSRRAPGAQTRLRRIRRSIWRRHLERAGYGVACGEVRREALAALLAERIGRGRPEAIHAWRGWWRAEGRAIAPRRLAADLAQRRAKQERRTLGDVLQALVRGPGAESEGYAEGELVSRLRGL